MQFLLWFAKIAAHFGWCANSREFWSQLAGVRKKKKNYVLDVCLFVCLTRIFQFFGLGGCLRGGLGATKTPLFPVFFCYQICSFFVHIKIQKEILKSRHCFFFTTILHTTATFKFVVYLLKNVNLRSRDIVHTFVPPTFWLPPTNHAHQILPRWMFFCLTRKNKNSTFTTRHCPYFCIPPKPNSYIYYWKKCKMLPNLRSRDIVIFFVGSLCDVISHNFITKYGNSLETE